MKPAFQIVSAPAPAEDTLQSQLAAMRRREHASSSLIWEPPRAAPPAAAKPVVIAIEEQILAAMLRPIDPAEGHRLGHDRKERELLALLDTLSPLEALTLRRRLAAARRGDQLAAAFGRMIVERRARVLAFLDDTRRRIALRRQA